MLPVDSQLVKIFSKLAHPFTSVVSVNDATVTRTSLRHLSARGAILVGMALVCFFIFLGGTCFFNSADVLPLLMLSVFLLNLFKHSNAENPEYKAGAHDVGK